MGTVDHRPQGANPQPSPAPYPPLDWGNPEAMKRWIANLKEQVKDAIAAGKDATGRMSDRRLSRVEARDKIASAERALDELFAAAETP